MLHDAEAGHRELGFQFREAAAVTGEEPVEEKPPRGVGKRLEHAVVVCHDGIDVTNQSHVEDMYLLRIPSPGPDNAQR